MKIGSIVMSAVLALGCGTMLGGSRPSTPQQSKEVLVALTDTQIAAAFSGRAAVGDDEDMIMGSGMPDMFCLTGAFWEDRHRAGVARGVYDIESGRLCTWAGRERRCRYVFRDSGGTVVMSNHQDGTRAWPVRFRVPTPQQLQRCAGQDRQIGQ